MPPEARSNKISTPRQIRGATIHMSNPERPIHANIPRVFMLWTFYLVVLGTLPFVSMSFAFSPYQYLHILWAWRRKKASMSTHGKDRKDCFVPPAHNDTSELCSASCRPNFSRPPESFLDPFMFLPCIVRDALLFFGTNTRQLGNICPQFPVFARYISFSAV